MWNNKDKELNWTLIKRGLKGFRDEEGIARTLRPPDFTTRHLKMHSCYQHRLVAQKEQGH